MNNTTTLNGALKTPLCRRVQYCVSTRVRIPLPGDQGRLSHLPEVCLLRNFTVAKPNKEEEVKELE